VTLTQKIAALSDDDFRSLVDRDLRREDTQEEAQALRSPDLVHRWYTILVAMSKSVDGQLAAKRYDYEAQKAQLRGQFVSAESALAEAKLHRDTPRVHGAQDRIRELRQDWALMTERYARSRAATLRFKSGLEETLVEARLFRDQIRDVLYESVVTEERNQLARRVRELEDELARLR
jgi:chromosome segregation ATPase